MHQTSPWHAQKEAVSILLRQKHQKMALDSIRKRHPPQENERINGITQRAHRRTHPPSAPSMPRKSREADMSVMRIRPHHYRA